MCEPGVDASMTLYGSVRVYRVDGACGNRWLLPLGGADLEAEARRLRPGFRRLRVVEMDGVPTLCVTVSPDWASSFVRDVGRAADAELRQRSYWHRYGRRGPATKFNRAEVILHHMTLVLGDALMRRFFEADWIAGRNSKTARRNEEDAMRGAPVPRNAYRTGSVRDFARMSI